MNEQQLERYDRHIILNEIGISGQEKLMQAKVLVVGAGGLGAPVLQYLVAAGIGTIGIIDADVVSSSNLQRQVLYREDEIGLSKAEQAKKTLQRLNGDVNIVAYPFMLNNENAPAIFANFDMVVGATDNFESRQIIDRATKAQKKAFIHGAIGEFEGQVSVFNYQGSPSYADLFPEVPDPATLPKGVMGVLPGIIGSMQACEVIKIICQIGENLSGRLLVYNALNFSFHILKY